MQRPMVVSANARYPSLYGRDYLEMAKKHFAQEAEWLEPKLQPITHIDHSYIGMDACFHYVKLVERPDKPYDWAIMEITRHPAYKGGLLAREMDKAGVFDPVVKAAKEAKLDLLYIGDQVDKGSVKAGELAPYQPFMPGTPVKDALSLARDKSVDLAKWVAPRAKDAGKQTGNFLIQHGPTAGKILVAGAAVGLVLLAAPFLLAGAAVSAIAADPVIFGARSISGKGYEGEPTAFYILAAWDWPKPKV